MHIQFTLSHKPVQSERFRHILQISAMLVVFATLTFLFYILPETAALTSSKNTSGSDSSVHNSNLYSETLSFSEANGIGGGSIIGNPSAGKKDLPIYCVDIASKIRQQAADSSDPNSLNDNPSNDNPSNPDSENSNANSNSGTFSAEPIVFSSDRKYAALSFDAAWGAEDTIQILDILDKYNVKVTFFMTGGWVDEYPDMVKEIYSRGHDLGNHSQNHKKMSELNIEQQKQEIMSVHDKVLELTGYNSYLFRPPYGDYNSTLITTAYGCNFYPIQWSVDSLDWKDYGVDKIVERVTQSKMLDNGAIILMHNGAKFTAQALESVITGLQDQGYTLVPISELIIRENFHMDGTGKQIAD